MCSVSESAGAVPSLRAPRARPLGLALDSSLIMPSTNADDGNATAGAKVFKAKCVRAHAAIPRRLRCTSVAATAFPAPRPPPPCALLAQVCDMPHVQRGRPEQTGSQPVWRDWTPVGPGVRGSSNGRLSASQLMCGPLLLHRWRASSTRPRTRIRVRPRTFARCDAATSS